MGLHSSLEGLTRASSPLPVITGPGVNSACSLARYPQSELMVLADEALLAFDPERFNKVAEGLKNYGKYIVVTKLTEPSKIPALTIIHK